jgi:dephospho-CoA kinase
MMIIGLTGGIGTGKSTVAAILRKAAIPVIDADDLSRQLTQKNSPVLEEICHEFGRDILDEKGELKRSLLAQIVFTDKQRLKKLEAILHPKIERLRERLFAQLKKQQIRFAVYMAPLLFEKDLHKQVSKTILIVADRDIIKDRLKKRDNMSETDIENRINAQYNDEQKISLADEIIVNNGKFEKLYDDLNNVWKKLTGSCLAEQSLS